MFNIVLVNPQIPQNTGNISRLTAANNCSLHLVGPMGFAITDRNVKRAGLDYWPEVKLHQYAHWNQFTLEVNLQAQQLWLLTTKVDRPYYIAEFKAGDFLIFGSETAGLPQQLHKKYHDRRLTIPMSNPNIRSLNLSNSAAIVLYEGLRQLDGTGFSHD